MKCWWWSSKSCSMLGFMFWQLSGPFKSFSPQIFAFFQQRMTVSFVTESHASDTRYIACSISILSGRMACRLKCWTILSAYLRRYAALNDLIIPWSRGCKIDVVLGGRNTRVTFVNSGGVGPVQLSGGFAGLGWVEQLSVTNAICRLSIRISTFKLRRNSNHKLVIIHAFLLLR